ncbi:MAG: methyltransferase domain-containing protein [Ignavibacteriae bacterium]|nr:methyltransferase domain-containing protein [Ignavibacteriota bacterium]
MNTTTIRKNIRRKEYNYRIDCPDYFVLKHLQRYLFFTIEEYVKSGMVVCDIGCGEQPLRNMIEKKGATYIGVDVSQNSTDSVQVLASITDIPLPENSFDIIFCTEVLEHVSDTYKAFSELSRILRPSGKLIITTPFAYPLHEEPYDYQRLTPYQITLCAKENKFHVFEIKTSGNELEVLATVWCSMWNRMNRRRKTVLHKYWDKLMRTPINILAVLGGYLLGNSLSKKYFLNVLAVFTK